MMIQGARCASRTPRVSRAPGVTGLARWGRAALCALLMPLATSCGPGGATGGGALTITIDGGASQVAAEGDPVTLSATAEGGTTPYAFRWSQERGDSVLPDETDLAQATVTTLPIEVQGEYSFRVTVVDAAGGTASATFVLRVGPKGTDSTTFQVLITDPPETIAFGQDTVVSAFTSTEGEVSYVWTVTQGMATLDGADTDTVTMRETDLGPLVIEVRATESATGQTSSDSASITVEPALTVDDLFLTQVDTPTTLAVDVQPAREGTRYAWTVASGQATLAGEDLAEVSVTPSAPETVTLDLTVTVPLDDGSEVTAAQVVSVVAVDDGPTRVRLSTNLGDLVFELDTDAAPLNSANFLRYVDEGFYEGLLIHRYSCDLNVTTGECVPFVIQGGGFRRGDSGLEFVDPTHDPVKGEQDNGLSNEQFTVAMALSANNPDSGTTQFFVNMGTLNGFLDDSFTVFARVVEGFDVLETITQMETDVDLSIGLNRPERLVDDVVMEQVTRE